MLRAQAETAKRKPSSSATKKREKPRHENWIRSGRKGKGWQGRRRRRRRRRRSWAEGSPSRAASYRLHKGRRGRGGRGMSRSFPLFPTKKNKKEKYGTWGKSREMERRISIFKKEKGPLVPCSMTKQRAKIRRGEKMEQGVFSSPSIRETEVRRRRRRTKNRSAPLPPVKRELLQHQ